ncbi:alpha/beta fold hydrolase [Rhodoferax sp. PAMC 29310]|uniref:alpha/beta fold hydrolase n=1 Tax=Rhodoferax sp. PAMC 29310 TaxID=2822760 RepID=UPI00272BC796|nr:alpha/beta fold hydrolase [Rhodoferax sp. PAMC 29310]
MNQNIRFCTSRDGTQIAFATVGTGPPLVRVNNWFTHLELDWDSSVWQHWSQALAEKRMLVRYDPRGSGLSDRNASDFSLDAMVSDLEAVVDALNLPRFSLLGLCQGGLVAVAYAARHPHRVSRLAIYDSYLHGAFVGDANDHLVQQARTFSTLIEMGWGRKVGAFREMFASLLMPDTSDPRQLKSIDDMQRLSASPEAACQLWNAFHAFDVRSEAPRVQTSALVFHVRGDAMVPFEAGRQLAAAIPNASFLPLEGKNHILRVNEPAWPVFIAALNEFLEGAEPHDAVASVPLSELTARERQVLDSMARGLANPEIAVLLGIVEKTLRNHVTRVFAKLGVSHRSQAIVIARKAGLGRD